MSKINLFFLLKTLAAIFVFSFVLDKVAFYGLNMISDKVFTGQGIGKLNHFLKVKDQKDLLVFGSSRANRHFVIKEISDNGFNVGVDGRKIAYPSALILTLPEHKKQTVILNLDIAYMLDSTNYGQDLDALQTKYGRIPIIKSQIEKFGHDNPLQKVYQSIGYNGFVISILYNYLFPKYDYRKYDGYDPNFIDKKQQENLAKMISSMPQENCKKPFIINDVTLRSYKQIAEFCRNNNKTLVFVTSPRYRDNCLEDNQFIADFMKNNGYKFLDYTNFFEHNNSLKYWKDTEHMANEGAVLFSKKLKEDLAALEK